MSFSTHPAFTTSFANREMFGWAERNEPTHSLLLDGCQRFEFTKLANGKQVKVVRKARNPLVKNLKRHGSSGSVTYQSHNTFKTTAVWVWDINQARNEYRRLRNEGAEVI